MQIRYPAGYSIQLIVITAIVTVCYITKNKIVIGLALAGVIAWGIINNIEMMNEFAKIVHNKTRNMLKNNYLLRKG